MSFSVGILAKWPQPGRAKTRLIPLLGEQGAAEVAMQLLLRSLQWIDDCPADVAAVLWTDGGEDTDWQRVLAGLKHPGRWTVQAQPSGHLGQRLHHAMAWQLSGSSTAALMGTDTPTLGAAHVQAVRAGLAAHDAVLIPALDGGYVMVGMRRLSNAAFGRLDWGSDRVAEQTRAALASEGLSQQWLAPEPDLDEPADYEAALRAGWLDGLG